MRARVWSAKRASTMRSQRFHRTGFAGMVAGVSLRRFEVAVPACERTMVSRHDAGASRAHILTVTLRFSPRFGSCPVNLALANSKAVTRELAGPSHNSAVKGSNCNKHTFESFGPPGHQTSSVLRQAAFVLSASRVTLARPVIDR